jgi:general secretion pathway protein B
MSFILDALKKSESERQRQSGPALFEVKVAPPRGRFAPWAVLLGALLMVNLVIVAWLALRSPRSERTPAVAAPLAAAGPVAAPPAQQVPYPPTAPASVAAGASEKSAAATSPLAEPPPQAVASRQAGVPVAVPAGEPREAAPATEGAAAADDYAPAVESQGGARPMGSVTRSTESGLPTYQDAAAVPGAGLPELRLDLHVFAAKPADRFVLINMTKLREGDSLPQGVHVDNITPDGAILSYHGTRFVLMHE